MANNNSSRDRGSNRQIDDSKFEQTPEKLKVLDAQIELQQAELKKGKTNPQINYTKFVTAGDDQGLEPFNLSGKS